MATKVLVVDSGLLSLVVTKEAFETAEFEVTTASTGAAALQQFSLARPEVVALDVGLPDVDGLEVCRRLKADRSAPLVVAFSRRREESPQRILAAGADDYMPKPSDPRELVARVRALLVAKEQRAPAAASAGPVRMFTFFSASGGVGTTSISVNTAAAIAAITQGKCRTVLADLVLPIGSVGLMVGLSQRETLATLARGNLDEVGPQAVEPFLFTKPRLGFQVLLGAPDPAQAQAISPAAVERIFDSLRTACDCLLVDVGRSLSRISMPLLAKSDRIVCVLGPTRAALHLTKVCLDYLTSEGIPPQRLVLVLNRPGVSITGDLNRSEIEDFLDRPLAYAVPYESNRFSEAADQGFPLTTRYPDCTAATVIHEFTNHLLDVGRGAPGR